MTIAARTVFSVEFTSVSDPADADYWHPGQCNYHELTECFDFSFDGHRHIVLQEGEKNLNIPSKCITKPSQLEKLRLYETGQVAPASESPPTVPPAEAADVPIANSSVGR